MKNYVFYAKMSHFVSQSLIAWHRFTARKSNQNGGEGGIGETAPHR